MFYSCIVIINGNAKVPTTITNLNKLCKKESNSNKKTKNTRSI